MILFLKHLLWLTIAVGLSACTASEYALKKTLEPMIYSQCQEQMNDSKLWRLSGLFMSNDQRKKLEQQTCDCVAENALNDIPIDQISQALVNESAKQALVNKVVLNSVSSCLVKIK